MKQSDRLDRMLDAWTDDAWSPPPPPYLDEVLSRTRRMRQRQAWASLERWLPMGLTLRRPALAMPLRLLAIVLALLLLLIAAMSVPLLVGTRSLPATVVTAWRNGLIAFGRDGDIWVVEPDGGDPRVLIDGPETDDGPDWSPDGTRIAFWRAAGSSSDLVVADADGQRATVITPTPMAEDASFWWSPDGSSFVISSTIAGVPSVSLLDATGGDLQTLDLGGPADSAAWHPDGRSIIVRRLRTPDGTGLYSVSIPDGVLGEPIATSDSASPWYASDQGQSDLIWPSYSADGSMITYAQGQLPLDGKPGVFGGGDLRTWVMAADGTGARMIEYAVESDYENAPAWAPSGTRLSMAVKTGGSNRLAIADVVRDTPIVATDPEENAGGDYHVWAPDGTAILVVRGVDWVTSLVDAATGARTVLPWLGGPPDWQPVGP